MIIRDARVEEADALEGLQRRSSAVWPVYRDQLAAHPDAIERLAADDIVGGRVRVALGDDGTTIVGFAAVLAADAEGGVELDGLFVEPDAMGRGVGRALVADAQSRAAAMTVVAGPEAEGFYGRCGFVHVADATTRFGPAAVLRWEAPITRAARPRSGG